MTTTDSSTSPVAPPVAPSDSSMGPLLKSLEQQILGKMDEIVEHLQSLQAQGQLDAEILKQKIHQVLNIAQAGLLIRTLPLLLDSPNLKGTLETANLFKKVHEVAELLKTLWKEQARTAIDSKAAAILTQIKAREQQIKQQIYAKQQAIAEIAQKFGQKP